MVLLKEELYENKVPRIEVKVTKNFFIYNVDMHKLQEPLVHNLFKINGDE